MSYAAVRVRGTVNIRKDIKDTLQMLRLNRVNHCVILPNDPPTEGMLRKVKDYITWGELKPEVLAKLILKRGRLEDGTGIKDSYVKKNTKFGSIIAFAKAVCEGKQKFTDLKLVKPVIRLHPPIKGYEGVKRSFIEGGALGYRGDNINELLDRMIFEEK
ncbi:MAG: 50S ribosomal protein L30 [Methanobacteriota archaeon]|nr:MAG: 50S ribosomal protein L30 [Euryarchaeota archaeon]